MYRISRRRFLEASILLASSSPLPANIARIGAKAPMDGVAMVNAVREARMTPAELIDVAISRLEKVNPQINAVAFANFEQARRKATGAPSGPLAGIPTLIKGLSEQQGLPFTSGSRGLQNRVGKQTTPYVEAVERLGVISIGRSNTPEFGLNVTTEPMLDGPTRNPWNLGHSAGGSSGGGGAAVAAGVVPIAHATDGGGSIRIPASVNGLVGLKPSRGRMMGSVTDRGVTALSVHNCVSRTVRDTAAWFAATEALEPSAPFSPIGVVTGPSHKRLHIGVHQGRSDGSPPHRDVQEAISNAIMLLEKLGHRVAQQPATFYDQAVAKAFVILSGTAAGRKIQEVSEHLGRSAGAGDIEPRTFAMAKIAANAGSAGFEHAFSTLTEAAQRYNAQFDTFDVYMTPVLALPPAPIGFLDPRQPYELQDEHQTSYVAYTPMENISGVPAISLPLGKSRDGLPIGIQFAAKPGGERVLLELAFELERELEWFHDRPPVWVAD